MTVETILFMMAALTTAVPSDRTVPIAQTIARLTHDPREAAALVAIEFRETSFGRPGSRPFGMEHAPDGLTLDQYGRRALLAYRWAVRACGPSGTGRFDRFHTYSCNRTEYGVSVEAMAEDAYRGYQLDRRHHRVAARRGRRPHTRRHPPR